MSGTLQKLLNVTQEGAGCGCDGNSTPTVQSGGMWGKPMISEKTMQRSKSKKSKKSVMTSKITKSKKTKMSKKKSKKTMKKSKK